MLSNSVRFFFDRRTDFIEEVSDKITSSEQRILRQHSIETMMQGKKPLVLGETEFQYGTKIIFVCLFLIIKILMQGKKSLIMLLKNLPQVKIC